MDGEVAWCKEKFLSAEEEEEDSYPAPPPANGQHDHDLSLHPTRQRLALKKDVKWPGNGVRLRVAFIDKPTPPIELQKRVVSHMNAWSEFCNVRFTLIDDYIAAEVRVSFSGKVLGEDDGGAWSYVGKQVVGITDRRRPTMMLTGFNMRTPEKAYTRTVRHETGHTLGFMHEHLRPELVKRIDREKTLREYRSVWDRKTIIDNILTPLWTDDDSNYSVSKVADVHSIMCYPLEDSILKDDMKEPPIEGGKNFSEYDKKHAAEVYPIPKYAARVISEDKQTVGIAAIGNQLYLRLLSGEIRAIFELTSGQLKTHNIGQVDDPINTKLLGSGLLYRVEDGYKVSRWDGVGGHDIKKWTETNKKSDNIQIDVCSDVVYFRDKAGMVVRFDQSQQYPWKQLHPGKDTSWISPTKTHLFRQNERGEIYKIRVPDGDPKTDWERIDRFTDTVQIASNWNHVYQHRENGEIWVYTGAGRFWFRVFKQQGRRPFLIQASEDRLFRIESHDDDDGADVWVNDDNTEQGWKPLKIKKNFSFFVYTGGFVYEFIQETGRVTRYTGIC